MIALKIIASVLLILIVDLAYGQSNTIFDYKIGTEISRDHYNGKGKLESRSTEKFLRCDTTAEGLIYAINMISYSPDGKELSNVEGTLKFVEGSIMIDMETIYHMKDNGFYEWTTESEYLEVPGTMSDGQKLADAKVVCTVVKEPRLKVAPAGSRIKSDMGAKVVYSITDRRVSIDKVATPASEFSAYKLISNVINESNLGYGYKVERITIDWYAQGAGLVKSQVLNKRGKVLSYSIMTKRIL
jgi:hypothetical protein